MSPATNTITSTIINPDLFYLSKVAPALLGVALATFVLGWLLATMLWWAGHRKERRLRGECERINREMRAARRKVL